MIKTITPKLKKSKRHSNSEEKNSDSYLVPSKYVVDSLLAYSKALFVKKSINIGLVENLMN